ncbi:hypothetical protein BDAP_000606 [Binucleata daphniae]
MAKQICRFFAESRTCRFGSRCHFLHIINTSLVHPPSWIFTSYENLPLQEFSFEEMRSFYYKFANENNVKGFFDIYDQIWLNNYEVLCDHLTELTKIANIAGEVTCEFDGKETRDNDEVIDFRSDVSCFVKPYNADFVCDEIAKRRENKKEVKCENRYRDGESRYRDGENRYKDSENRYKDSESRYKHDENRPRYERNNEYKEGGFVRQSYNHENRYKYDRNERMQNDNNYIPQEYNKNENSYRKFDNYSRQEQNYAPQNYNRNESGYRKPDNYKEPNYIPQETSYNRSESTYAGKEKKKTLDDFFSGNDKKE